MRPKGFKHSKETREKMSKALLGNTRNKGRKLSEEWKHKIGISNKGDKQWNWKGENVSPHEWIKKKLGKPNYCEHCKRSDKRCYDWSNKDHKYRKVLEDWQRLCRSCHMKFDFKFNNRRKYEISKKL